MAAKILKKKLEKKSFKVFLTRTSDYYVRLKNRVKYARSKSPDLFISIHADSTQNKNTSGTSIYSLSEKASDKLAQALADREKQIRPHCWARFRGIRQGRIRYIDRFK